MAYLENRRYRMSVGIGEGEKTPTSGLVDHPCT